MRKISFSLFCIMLICLAVFAGNKCPEGFSPLFNGKNLDGWKRDAEVEEHWKVRDGVLTYDGKGQNLVTEKDYRNFILKVEWKIEKGGDSGIYLRGKPQVQIWDNPKGSGGLYNDKIDPKKNVDKPVGEWNSFTIIMRGKRVTVFENGVRVVDNAVMNSIDGMPDKGPIELQNHGNPLWFRNIYIKELP